MRYAVEYDHKFNHWNELNIVEIANQNGINKPLFVFTNSEGDCTAMIGEVKKNGMLNIRTLNRLNNLQFCDFQGTEIVAKIISNTPRFGWRIIKDNVSSCITQSCYIDLPHAFGNNNLYPRILVRTPENQKIYVTADSILDLLINYPGAVNPKTLEIDLAMYYDVASKDLAPAARFERVDE